MSRSVRVGDRFISCSGDREIDVFTPTVKKDGVVHLDVTSKKDIYPDIQSHKDSVDIHVLLTQYANGDISALEKAQGFYADISSVPRTYSEVFQALKDGEAEFYKLPVEVREEFGHSFERWLSTAGSEDWMRKMGVSNVKDKNEVLSDNVGNEGTDKVAEE